jgi:hypothetical protein
LLLSSGGFAAERFKRLSAAEVKTLLLNREITDEGHWSYHFKVDGVLDAMDLGQAKQGTWRLAGKELCLDTREKGKVVSDCYEVWRSNSNIRFLRDGVPIFEGILQDN